MSGMDFTVPSIVLETPSWALVFKPHGIPSAPLSEGESGTILSWFLSLRGEAGVVAGKKAIERGLLHRLDTGTAGLVLIAKTQVAYDALADAQAMRRIRKGYLAFCVRDEDSPDSLLRNQGLPFAVRSRFRAFGPGRKRVRPLFPGMRGYDEAGRDYETVIEEVETVESIEKTDVGIARIRASLALGYRHQVRAHLAFLGYPIAGDPLYSKCPAPRDEEGLELPLQLYAPSISFPDPVDGTEVSFSLQLPDRMSR